MYTLQKTSLWLQFGQYMEGGKNDAKRLVRRLVLWSRKDDRSNSQQYWVPTGHLLCTRHCRRHFVGIDLIFVTTLCNRYYYPHLIKGKRLSNLTELHASVHVLTSLIHQSLTNIFNSLTGPLHTPLPHIQLVKLQSSVNQINLSRPTPKQLNYKLISSRENTTTLMGIFFFNFYKSLYKPTCQHIMLGSTISNVPIDWYFKSITTNFEQVPRCCQQSCCTSPRRLTFLLSKVILSHFFYLSVNL